MMLVFSVCFLCRDLLELANIHILETEACPTWLGKLIGVCQPALLSSVLECFHACALELRAKQSYCPLLLWELRHVFNGTRLHHSLTSV